MSKLLIPFRVWLATFPTYDAAATELDVKYVTLCRWVRGERKPSPSHVKLAAQQGVDLTNIKPDPYVTPPDEDPKGTPPPESEPPKACSYCKSEVPESCLAGCEGHKTGRCMTGWCRPGEAFS